MPFLKSIAKESIAERKAGVKPWRKTQKSLPRGASRFAEKPGYNRCRPNIEPACEQTPLAGLAPELHRREEEPSRANMAGSPMALSHNREMSNHSLVADLYKNYAPAILNYLCRKLPTREDAEDVLLEVFQAALESNRLSDLDPNHQAAWLWSVARNKHIDHLHRFQRLPQVPLDAYTDALYSDELAMPEPVALRSETHAALRSQLATLTEQQQHVLLLRFGHDLRGPEIAARLNKNEGAVRAILSRALNHLRDLYSQSGEEEANV